MNLSARLARAEAKTLKPDNGSRVFGVAAARSDRAEAIEFARCQGWGKGDWLMLHFVDADPDDDRLPSMAYVKGISEMIDSATGRGRHIFDRGERWPDPFNPEFVVWADPVKNRPETDLRTN